MRQTMCHNIGQGKFMYKISMRVWTPRGYVVRYGGKTMFGDIMTSQCEFTLCSHPLLFLEVETHHMTDDSRREVQTPEFLCFDDPLQCSPCHLNVRDLKTNEPMARWLCLWSHVKLKTWISRSFLFLLSWRVLKIDCLKKLLQVGCSKQNYAKFTSKLAISINSRIHLFCTFQGNPCLSVLQGHEAFELCFKPILGINSQAANTPCKTCYPGVLFWLCSSSSRDRYLFTNPLKGTCCRSASFGFMEFAHVPSYSHSEGADTATSNPEQIYPQTESSSYKLKMILNDFWHAILVHVLQIWDTKPPILEAWRWSSAYRKLPRRPPWNSNLAPEPLSAMEDKQFWRANKAMTWIWYPNEINEWSSLACSAYSKRWAPIPVRLRYWDHEVWRFDVVENEDLHVLWRSSDSCGHGFRPVLPFCGFFLSSF